jgi:TolB-like protein/DNA-binding winged helix-turn-helix (wHTH) protein/Flp pilus assembly protein TadD
MVDDRQRSYRFADFTLEAGEHRLRRGTQEIYLRPKTFETLLYLIERCGHLITKDELLDALWADTMVTEGTLTHCIEEVRKALRDEAHHPRFIQTVPRVGYKFIAEVEATALAGGDESIEEEYSSIQVVVTEETHEGAGTPTAWGNGPVSLPLPPASLAPSSRRLPLPLSFGLWPRRHQLWAALGVLGLLVLSGLVLHYGPDQRIGSIAVLPFINLSADPEQEYFADGMTEALIGDLARIKALRVISRTSVMPYKKAKKPVPEIARELNVDAIVEGSVLRSGERVRISAQLIHAPTDRHVWGQSYERDLRDILELQRDLARSIAQGVRITVMPPAEVRPSPAHPINPDVYQAFLKGRYFWGQRTSQGYRKGIEYFHEAIAREPTYAPAYAGLADCYALLGGGTLAPREVMPKARAAALKALEIDESLAEAHTSLAFVRHRFDWDWAGAEQDFKRAIELNPNYATAHQWYGFYLTTVGRFGEALREMRRAQELDPLSVAISTSVGTVFYYQRQYDRAIEVYEKVVEMESDAIGAHEGLGRAYAEKGRFEPARTEFLKAREISGGRRGPGLLGHLYGLSGERDQARKIIEELKERSEREYLSPYSIARIYIGLGEKDPAFQWLEQAYEVRDEWSVFLKVNPIFDTLRADPRFADLQRRVGPAP